MNWLRQWLGLDLKGELEKTRIALGVAREIAEEWKKTAQNSEKQVIELIADNERLKASHEQLTETHKQQQRCADKLATALGRVTPMINRP